MTACATFGDGIVAFAGVVGAISGDAGDLLIKRDLVEQFAQHGRVADVAGREPRRPDFQRLLINSDVDLAAAAVLDAVASGDLTPTEGALIMALVETYRRTLETTELEARVAALEGGPVAETR